MRWQRGRRSQNIEDRRGRGVRAAGAGIGGGAILIVLLFALLTGEDPGQLVDALEQGGGATPASDTSSSKPPELDARADFVSVVLADTEDTWRGLFRKMGRRYQEPLLVLFNDAVHSACGFNSAAVGPFYCPADHQVYIDLSFFNDLHSRFGAPGDFAQAYVIAHEVGHHVQNLLGISKQIQLRRMQVSQREASALSVRQELQADCLAGVWAFHADQQRDLLEEGDVEEGLNAAAAIGDDRLQRQNSGYVNPESWTHGSSQQRVQAFRTGLQTGDVERCFS